MPQNITVLNYHELFYEYILVADVNESNDQLHDWLTIDHPNSYD